MSVPESVPEPLPGTPPFGTLDTVLVALSDGAARSYPEVWWAAGFTRSTPEVARALAQLEQAGEVVVSGNGLGRTYRLSMERKN